MAQASKAPEEPWSGRYDWEAVEQLYPGLQYVKFRVDEPRAMLFNVIRLDLQNTNYRFRATPRHADWGSPMPYFEEKYLIRTGRQTTLQFVQESRAQGYQMVAAVNAAPWRPWSELSAGPPEMSYRQHNFPWADRLGLLISDGELVDYPNRGGSLVFFRDGTIDMVAARNWGEDEFATVHTAVTGFNFVLNDGVATGSTSLAPRSGTGLSRDRRYLILMTVDSPFWLGRQVISHIEVGHWLHHFGSWDGINMDGGGSNSMVLVEPGSKTARLVNNPAYGPRAVGASLGILLPLSP